MEKNSRIEKQRFIKRRKNYKQETIQRNIRRGHKWKRFWRDMDTFPDSVSCFSLYHTAINGFDIDNTRVWNMISYIQCTAIAVYECPDSSRIPKGRLQLEEKGDGDEPFHFFSVRVWVCLFHKIFPLFILLLFPNLIPLTFPLLTIAKINIIIITNKTKIDKVE